MIYEEVIHLLWAILVVVAVLVLAYAFTRFVAGRAGGRFHYRGRRITVLEQVPVGRDQKILLVKLGEGFYFLGSAQGTISCLTQVSPEEVERWRLEDEAQSQTAASLGFREALRKVMDQRKDRGGS